MTRPSKIYPNWDFWLEKQTIWQPWRGIKLYVVKNYLMYAVQIKKSKNHGTAKIAKVCSNNAYWSHNCCGYVPTREHICGYVTLSTFSQVHNSWSHLFNLSQKLCKGRSMHLKVFCRTERVFVTLAVRPNFYFRFINIPKVIEFETLFSDSSFYYHFRRKYDDRASQFGQSCLCKVAT
jgi:hypothetical protein